MVDRGLVRGSVTTVPSPWLWFQSRSNAICVPATGGRPAPAGISLPAAPPNESRYGELPVPRACAHTWALTPRLPVTGVELLTRVWSFWNGSVMLGTGTTLTPVSPRPG